MASFSKLAASLPALFWLVLGASATPQVNIGMKAAFPAGPYLLELLETAAGENATSYFPILDRIAQGRFASLTTDAELYDAFLDVLADDGHVTSPEALSTFKLALSLRAAAPRIEAHYQYYQTSVEPKLGTVDQEGCEVWVQVENQQFCDPSLLKPSDNNDLSPVKALPFDRTLEQAGKEKVVVLYADPLSPNFAEYHLSLAESARRGELAYRLRYRRHWQESVENLPVNGYGVELALKRTDYIVIDDRDAENKQKPLGNVADSGEEVTDLKPLSSSDLAGLGPKTASYILQSENPFEMLVKVLQDFPKYSASIASHEVSDDYIKEDEENRGHSIPSGISYLWINGMQLIERQIQPFALLDMVRRERTLLGGMRELGFNGKEAVALLGHQKVAASKAADDSLRFDWTDGQEEGKAIIWLNDIESDEMYSDFADSVAALLQRTYPGQLPAVARNLFTVVMPADFTNPDDLGAVAQMTSLIQRGIPIRFGLVPITPTQEAKNQAKVVYHLMKEYNPEALSLYLKNFMEGTSTTADEGLYVEAVKSLDSPREDHATWADILGSKQLEHQLSLASHWLQRLKAGAEPRPLFVNGAPLPRQGDWMRPMSMKINEDLQTLQRSVYQQVIDDETSIPGFFLEKAASKRNIYIAPEDGQSIRVVDVGKLYIDHAGLFEQTPVIEASKDASKEDWAALTVVSDLNTDAGIELLLSALAFKRKHAGARIDVVHNPVAPVGSGILVGVLKAKEETLHELTTIEAFKNLEAKPATSDLQYQPALTSFLHQHGIAPGTSLLLMNGRLIGPFTADEPFVEDDFDQLLSFERSSRFIPVFEALDDLGFSDRITDPLAAAKLTSLTALSTESDLPEGIFEAPPGVRTGLYEKWASKHTAIEVGNPETATVHIAGLLDPASEKGQMWAPVLKVLSELDGVYLKLFMNPKGKMEELPIKRFYRYVLDSKPRFDGHGRVMAHNATFTGLPSEALLTAGMDVPPAWLVAPKASVHDLDNIKLSSMTGDVEAVYELEHILVEGHSREGKGAPPKGAQLVLGTEKDAHITDTIIMANLGFFQFKANPGFYNIHLEQGRSSEIYDIESVGAKGWEAAAGDEGTDVAVMDFQGTTLYPRLTRKKGMENADVLESDEDVQDDSIVAKGMKFAESFLGSKTKSPSAEAHAEINIFSVASGHLYERMLNIMMVSVMKHTKHTVKFWFIEQFLSPEFKDFIPQLAEEYGFKYEMVTYKWPHWLRQQKEKQREIWGYKILFLDVLFPLNLDKVIFVDADQIVRTDMMELVRHDLEGAPYGFTPMCDSRTEMEGFRFWKQGYWASFLRGLPYHISALYVVDLRRFRAMGAGDRLRQQYHSLSADPNSLSNLDQDLPNNMQFQIPIHSLPQEWLWCETWCSDESFPRAKTIDLCNNPQTKEPKLDRARRQVPEWTVYDDEIKGVAKRRREEEESLAKAQVVEVSTETETVQQVKTVSLDVNTKSRRFEGEKDEL